MKRRLLVTLILVLMVRCAAFVRKRRHINQQKPELAFDFSASAAISRRRTHWMGGPSGMQAATNCFI